MPLIVFDLDGTLVDSRQDLADSANEMLDGYGAPPRPVDEIAQMVGDGARVLVARALDAAGCDAPLDEALDRFRAIYDRRLLRTTRPYDGVPAAVSAAASVARVALLTNKPEAPSRRLLEAFDLTRHFAWVIGGDSGFTRKPDPAALVHLAAAAGAPGAATLMVGDSMVDVETARRAGTAMLAADYGFGHVRDPLVLRPGEGRIAESAALGGVLERWARTGML